jgi:uncharacterized integral membrane protein
VTHEEVHERGLGEQQPARSRRSRNAEALIGGAIILAIVVIGILVQQTVFYRFVQQNGGTPDGLFKKAGGASYKLWAFTVPLGVTTASIVVVGTIWVARLRKLQGGWLLIAVWIIYVAVMWSLFGASSGLVEVLGKGEAFI